jgi:hypothetical protein
MSAFFDFNLRLWGLGIEVVVTSYCVNVVFMVGPFAFGVGW